jgi:energy-coupling factor transport system substrate-specific component
MANKVFSVKIVVAIAVGAAITFVLGKFVSIPTWVPSTNIYLNPAVISLFAAIFGPVAGFFVAFISHTLSDLTGGGAWWSWILANGVYGLLVGLFWKLYKIEEGNFGIKELLIFNGIQIAANAIAWIGIAPTLDILIYAEPADKVFLQGVVAGASNAIVTLILGSILIFGYSKARPKAKSLKAE